MWTLVKKEKLIALQERVEQLEVLADARDNDFAALEEDLGMAEACLKTLRENKLDILLCESLLRSFKKSLSQSFNKDVVKETLNIFNDDILDDSQHLFESSRRTLSQINQEIETISRRAQTSGYELEEITKNAEKVTKLFHTVLSVAEETRLLTINAKIGAADTSFDAKAAADLAEEMMMLSSQASTATQEVQAVIKEIAAQSNQAKQQVNQLLDLSSSIGLTAGTVEEAVTEVIWSAEDYKKIIQRQHWIAMIRLAQWEHITSKSILSDLIINQQMQGHEKTQKLLQASFFSEWVSQEKVHSQLSACASFDELMITHTKIIQTFENLLNNIREASSEKLLNELANIDEEHVKFVKLSAQVLNELLELQKKQYSEQML